MGYTPGHLPDLLLGAWRAAASAAWTSVMGADWCPIFLLRSPGRGLGRLLICRGLGSHVTAAGLSDPFLGPHCFFLFNFSFLFNVLHGVDRFPDRAPPLLPGISPFGQNM